MYPSDGSGNFTLLTTSISDLSYSNLAFADVDGDNDLDLVVVGLDVSWNPLTELYLNDGSGNYSLSSAVFTYLTEASLAFDDIEGDAHPFHEACFVQAIQIMHDTVVGQDFHLVSGEGDA